MTYRIEPGVNLEMQLKNVFAGQIQTAVRSLQDYPHLDPEGLHSARKCLKRLRALLRLLRKKKFKTAQKTYNYRLRDIGATLSPYRDHEVLDLLLSPFTDQIAEGSPATEIQTNVRESVISDLEALGNTFEKTVLTPFAIRHLKKGMETCREIMVAAHRQYAITKSKVHLHEFRKRVKDHSYHMLLLGAFLQPNDSYQMQINELEDLLGDARDCDLVLDLLEGPNSIDEDKAKEAKVHFILTRDRIMKEAMKLASTTLGKGKAS